MYATSLLLSIDAGLCAVLVLAPYAFPEFVEDAALLCCAHYVPLRKSVMVLGAVLTTDLALLVGLEHGPLSHVLARYVASLLVALALFRLHVLAAESRGAARLFAGDRLPRLERERARLAQLAKESEERVQRLRMALDEKEAAAAASEKMGRLAAAGTAPARPRHMAAVGLAAFLCGLLCGLRASRCLLLQHHRPRPVLHHAYLLPTTTRLHMSTPALAPTRGLRHTDASRGAPSTTQAAELQAEAEREETREEHALA